MPAVSFRTYVPPFDGGFPPDIQLFRRAMKLHYVDYYPELVRYGDSELKPGEICLETAQEQGTKVAGEVFSSPRESWPDGIVIGDDMMTAGALRQLQVLGIKPGVDIKIASHANRESSVLYGYENEITLVEYDPMEIALMLFETAGTIISSEQRCDDFIVVKPKVRTALITA